MPEKANDTNVSNYVRTFTDENAEMITEDVTPTTAASDIFGILASYRALHPTAGLYILRFRPSEYFESSTTIPIVMIAHPSSLF